MVNRDILYLFPNRFRNFFSYIAERRRMLQEIRLRAMKPIYVLEEGKECFLDRQGYYTSDMRKARILMIEELEEIINHICQYSLYAYEDELKQGFLTVPGGHRVGIAGKAVLNTSQEIKTLKYMSSLNIRIAHEVLGAANAVLPYLYKEGRLLNTVIISPPGCGKTTLLRDIVRQVSDGNNYGKGISVGLVDERSEIAGCYHGCPQNDVGIRTDILDSCPKEKGMMMLVRSMSPGAIAIDELGEPQEWKALAYASYCGTAVLATMHGEGIYDYIQRNTNCHFGYGDIFQICIILRKYKTGCEAEKIYEIDREGNWKCLFQKS